MATGSPNINTATVRSSYYGICHPDVEEDIRGISGFVGVEQYGGYTDTMPFEFGSVNGVRWCASEVTYISLNGATSAAAGFRPTGAAPNDLYSSFIYGQEAVGTVGLGENHAEETYQMYDPSRPPAVELIYHAPGTSGVYDLYNEVGSISWKSWFAGKILNANWIVCVRTLATKL
jgi:N4-gp56 family major capsid protein